MKILSFIMLIFLMPNVHGDLAPSKCVKLYDAGMNSASQHLFRFYNGCGIDLYIDANVLGDDGNYKNYSSGRKVPANGNFTIYTAPFVRAESINWSASPAPLKSIPPLPNNGKGSN